MHLLFSSQAVGTFLIPEIDFHQPNGENIAEQTVNLGYILWPKLDPVRSSLIFKHSIAQYHMHK